MKRWVQSINAACVGLSALAVFGVAVLAIMEHRALERWHKLLDAYPISSYELPPPLDLEIPMVYGWQRATKIELLRVKPEKIGPQHFRDPAIETQNHWEPGGWIADDPPIIKGESAHPKGTRFVSTGEPDPIGGYRPRPEFKPYTRIEGVGKVTSAMETRSDKE